MLTSSVVGVPHADEERGQMAAAFINLKYHKIKNVLKENKIKLDILEFLIRKINKEHMPLGGIYFAETFPQTAFGKTDKNELIQKITNKNRKH